MDYVIADVVDFLAIAGLGILATSAAGLLVLALIQRRHSQRRMKQLQAELRVLQGQLETTQQINRDWATDAERLVDARLAIRREKLNGSRAELEQTKLRLRGLAHDIRNPLLAIRFASEELYSALSGEDLQQRVGDQLEGLDRCAGLVTNMVSSLSSDETAPLKSPATAYHTERLTKFVQTRLRSLAGRSLDDRVTRATSCPDQIITQWELVERVLDNLLGNAFEHAGGRDVAVHLSGTSEELVVRVSDGGPGLTDAQFQALLCRRAMRTQEARGMGLSVVVDLVEQLDARLEVHALPNCGTTFWIRLERRPSTEGSCLTPLPLVSIRPGAGFRHAAVAETLGTNVPSIDPLLAS